MRPRIAALSLALMSAAAMAQLVTPDPDWREVEAPPPPALQVQGVVPLEMPQSGLRFGVQPGSISIGKDGIVRYVVVATSTTGAVNAMYEGLRCDRGEVRTYARHDPVKGWIEVDTQWRSLFDGSNVVRHSLAIARTGACIGHSANGSPAQIVRDLRNPAAERFRSEYR